MFFPHNFQHQIVKQIGAEQSYFSKKFPMLAEQVFFYFSSENRDKQLNNAPYIHWKWFLFNLTREINQVNEEVDSLSDNLESENSWLEREQGTFWKIPYLPSPMWFLGFAIEGFIQEKDYSAFV